MNLIERMRDKIKEMNVGFLIPDINKSEYRKLANAVIHLGVRIIPSDSECTSCIPWATPSVKTGFFLCRFHKHIDLNIRESQNKYL